jgi:RHS repeat-associated protein
LAKVIFFAYDNNGNILSKRAAAYNIAVGRDEIMNFTAEQAYAYDGGNSDRLVDFDGESIAYNEIGNPLSYMGKTLEWQNGRQLKTWNLDTQNTNYRVENEQHINLRFVYDGQGRRIKKGSTVFTYDIGGKLIQQSDGANTLEFIYDGSGLSGVRHECAEYVYRRDVFGNITNIFDLNGTCVVKYVYDAWGNHKAYDINGTKIYDSSVGATAGYEGHIGNLNAFRYRGYFYDTETGLYFLKTRYFDSQTGRFISQDSVEYLDPETVNGLNLYAYCNNNCVNMLDPLGNKAVWWNPFSWFDGVSNIGKIIIGAALFVGAIALTVATGGALAPLFITMAVGVGISTAIGGFGAVIASGGDWSQFGSGAWNGFADGVLWGGIFSFAGASVGAIKYAAKGSQGALQGTTKLTTITKGQQLDRFGHLGGKFITNAGTPTSQLALPAANTGIKTTLQATKNFRAFTGIVANGFGGTGGGTQYVMRYSIQTLLKKGWLIIV